MAEQKEKIPVSLDQLDDMMSTDINEIAELPQFVNPQEGVWKMKCTGVEKKEIAEKPAFSFNFEILESIELKNPEDDLSDDVVKAGDKCNFAFFVNTTNALEFFKSQMKTLLAPIFERTGARSIPEAFAAMKDAEFAVVVKHRRDKDYKTNKKWYIALDSLQYIE